MAVSMIGDIDRDSISDVAISAPYEASGVVYIYRGNRGGLMAEYQVAGEGGREGGREGSEEGEREEGEMERGKKNLFHSSSVPRPFRPLLRPQHLGIPCQGA